MIRLFFITIFVGLSFGCWKGRPFSESGNSIQKDSIIVFFDIKNYSRLELGQFIDRINEFDPKIIALSVQFDSLKDHRADSVLAQSILNENNVILSSSINNLDRSLMRSNSKFSDAALTEGVLSYIVNKDSITAQYVPLFQNTTEQMTSFPHAIVFNFDPSTITKFEGLRINSISNIKYEKGLDEFLILNENNLRLELIKGKIVLLASLDTSESSYFILLDGVKKKVPSVGITANIVLELLSEP